MPEWARTPWFPTFHADSFDHCIRASAHLFYGGKGTKITTIGPMYSITEQINQIFHQHLVLTTICSVTKRNNQRIDHYLFCRRERSIKLYISSMEEKKRSSLILLDIIMMTVFCHRRYIWEMVVNSTITKKQPYKSPLSLLEDCECSPYILHNLLPLTCGQTFLLDPWGLKCHICHFVKGQMQPFNLQGGILLLDVKVYYHAPTRCSC